MNGHAVLAVPVPALEDFVRQRTAHYDNAYVAADPDFVHAHITLLAPWLEAPAEADLATVAGIAARRRCFDVVLEELAVFPDGTIHLRPEPDAPLRALTRELTAAFPQCVPYEGRYPELVPHLTLDREAHGVDVHTVRARLEARIPAHVRVDRVDLQWWAPGDCHRRASWMLGS